MLPDTPSPYDSPSAADESLLHAARGGPGERHVPHGGRLPRAARAPVPRPQHARHVSRSAALQGGMPDTRGNDVREGKGTMSRAVTFRKDIAGVKVMVVFYSE